MIKIRPLTPGDIRRAVEIVGTHDPAHAEMAERDLNAYFENRLFPGTLFIGAEIEEQLAGIVGLYDDPDPDVKNICWMIWLYVDSGVRKRGVGRALHSAILQEARRRSARKVYLDIGNEEDHQTAIDWYLKFGYVQEGKLCDYFEEGEHKLLFSIRLKDKEKK